MLEYNIKVRLQCIVHQHNFQVLVNLVYSLVNPADHHNAADIVQTISLCVLRSLLRD